VKDVAQIGATIGREFSYALVATVAALPEKGLKAALAQLVHAELIFQRGAPPDATFVFKHALVQEAAYASLVRSRRQRLHGAIARALEQGFADIVTTEPETLAHHFTEAGFTEPAIGYWLKAGQRASERSAYPEALRHLERGLAILKALPESADRDRGELDYQIALDYPISAVRGWTSPEAEARPERATVLSEKLGDAQHLYASLSAQFLYWNVTGKNRKARETAERCRTLAMRQGDRVMQLDSH
jgi:predicted ATPase